MAGDEDDDGIFEDDPTHLDEMPPIPEAVPERDSTGKYKTLQGFQIVSREVEIAQARAEQEAYDMMALKLAMMASGSHPAVADAQVEKLRRWAADPANDRMIRVALRRA